MDIEIKVPYSIKSEVWILRENDVFIAHEEFPINFIRNKNRWEKEKVSVGFYIINENNITIVVYDKQNNEMYLNSSYNNFYIFSEEKIANKKLEKLNMR